MRTAGAILVQRIPGDPDTVRTTLDQLVEADQRFLDESEPEPQTYTVQSGDTLYGIARQFYGQASLWTIIFEANRDILSEPSQIKPGQMLIIPPKPA